jgi:hypothetical protein
MNQKLFQATCAALWGPQYQSVAARELDIALRSVVRYDQGERAVPKAVIGRLGGLLDQRQAKIAALRPKVVAAFKVAP